MKDKLYLLLILLIVGILWLGSGYWKFSREDYVNSAFTEKSQITAGGIDLELLKREFQPAYEL